jgi:hypothetical protein
MSNVIGSFSVDKELQCSSHGFVEETILLEIVEP